MFKDEFYSQILMFYSFTKLQLTNYNFSDEILFDISDIILSVINVINILIRKIITVKQ